MNLLHPTNKSTRKAKAKHVLLHQVARDPYIDWLIIFSVSTLVGLVLIIVGVLTYIDMSSRLEDSANASANPSNTTIDTKALTKVLADWSSRANEHTDLLKNFSGPSDPSF